MRHAGLAARRRSSLRSFRARASQICHAAWRCRGSSHSAPRHSSLRLIASGVAVVTRVSKLLLETIASLLDEDFYLRFERSFRGSSTSRCRVTAGAKLCNRGIDAMKFGGLDVPFCFAADLAACDLAELALQVGVARAMTMGLERLRLTTHSIVHDVGALAIRDRDYCPGGM